MVMAALTTGAHPPGTAADVRPGGPRPGRTSGPATADRSGQAVRSGRTVRSWPLLVLAAPAAAEVWSGWVGIAQKTGFGLVAPLPGIWPSLHLDTAITLPVGVEAYAAYALRAWLASEHQISPRTRRFAKWSAMCSFALGMAGQVAYHLLTQAGLARAPWPITTIVSCLPVLVLGMGTTLAHMLRADAAVGGPGTGTSSPAMARSSTWPTGQPGGDQGGPDQDQPVDGVSGPPDRGARPPSREPGGDVRVIAPEPGGTRAQMDHVQLIARRLAAAGQPVSRRALRGAGVKGSNELLGAVARNLNAELADQGKMPSVDGL
jgi:hypothetical protein